MIPSPSPLVVYAALTSSINPIKEKMWRRIRHDNSYRETAKAIITKRKNDTPTEDKKALVATVSSHAKQAYKENSRKRIMCFASRKMGNIARNHKTKYHHDQLPSDLKHDSSSSSTRPSDRGRKIDAARKTWPRG